MIRTKRSLLLALLILCAAALTPTLATAQSSGFIPDHSCQIVPGATDQFVVSSGWSSWGTGLFSRFQFHSWGSAPARPWPGRTSVAVLRERRGLVR